MSLQQIENTSFTIRHGATDNALCGPYFVAVMRGLRLCSAITGITTPGACHTRAEECSRSYGATILTPYPD